MIEAPDISRPETAHEPAHRDEAGANTALYAVLRRIAPALKHDMVVHLQAVSMRAEVIAARLEKGAKPSPEDMQKDLMSIHRLAREAVASCLNVMSWIEAPQDGSIDVALGIDECVAVARTSLGLRGVEVSAQPCPARLEVDAAALRNMLIAAMLVLADERDAEFELFVECRVGDGEAQVFIRPGAPRERLSLRSGAAAHPALKIVWADLQSLAQVQHAAISRAGDVITLSLQRHLARSPLTIAAV